MHTSAMFCHIEALRWIIPDPLQPAPHLESLPGSFQKNNIKAKTSKSSHSAAFGICHHGRANGLGAFYEYPMTSHDRHCHQAAQVEQTLDPREAMDLRSSILGRGGITAVSNRSLGSHLSAKLQLFSRLATAVEREHVYTHKRPNNEDIDH